MATPRILVCLCLLAPLPLLNAQAPPTAYTITQAVGSPGSTTTIYRNGSKALMVIFLPAQGATPASTTDNLIDIAGGTNLTWNPNDSNVGCSAGTFSGDWGDPFAAIADLSADIANGNLKPTGTETLDGISTTIYTGSTQGVNVKAWIDQKDSPPDPRRVQCAEHSSDDVRRPHKSLFQRAPRFLVRCARHLRGRQAAAHSGTVDCR